MTTTIAMLVTDSARARVTDDINGLSDFSVLFGRACAAIDPAMTWAEPATHWYLNASAVPDDVRDAWQAYAAGEPALILFTAINADNPYEWAVSNLASQGLQFVPAHEIE